MLARQSRSSLFLALALAVTASCEPLTPLSKPTGEIRTDVPDTGRGAGAHPGVVNELESTAWCDDPSTSDGCGIQGITCFRESDPDPSGPTTLRRVRAFFIDDVLVVQVCYSRDLFVSDQLRTFVLDFDVDDDTE